MAEQSSKKKDETVVVEDDELDDLLDSALGDFGKHVPKAAEEKSDDDLFRSLFGDASGTDMEQAKKFMSELLPGGDIGEFPPPEGLEAFENIFSEEFAKAAEEQMKEAFELLSKENPDLLQQFDQLAPELTGASMGASQSNGGDGKGSPSPSCQKKVASNVASPGEAGLRKSPKQQRDPSKGGNGTPVGGGEGKKEASNGEKGTAAAAGGGGGGGEGGPTTPDLHSAVDEALKSMQENAENVGKMSGPPDISSFLPGLGGMGAGGGEDGLMSMMEQMMGKLLSKDILYPPLKDFCQQYPEWLLAHKEEVPEADYSRYAQQLDVMRKVCSEFEGESPQESKEEEQTRFERILQLMHQLQLLGQPPTDLLQGMGRGVDLPPSPPLPNSEQCSVM